MTYRTPITKYMPGTLRQLVHRSGASMRSVKRWVRKVDCHITGYIKYSPIYTAGPGTDAPIPQPTSNAERTRNCRARQSQRKKLWFAALIP